MCVCHRSDDGPGAQQIDEYSDAKCRSTNRASTPGPHRPASDEHVSDFWKLGWLAAVNQPLLDRRQCPTHVPLTHRGFLSVTSRSPTRYEYSELGRTICGQIHLRNDARCMRPRMRPRVHVAEPVWRSVISTPLRLICRSGLGLHCRRDTAYAAIADPTSSRRPSPPCPSVRPATSMSGISPMPMQTCARRLRNERGHPLWNRGSGIRNAACAARTDKWRTRLPCRGKGPLIDNRSQSAQRSRPRLAVVNRQSANAANAREPNDGAAGNVASYRSSPKPGTP